MCTTLLIIALSVLSGLTFTDGFSVRSLDRPPISARQSALASIVATPTPSSDHDGEALSTPPSTASNECSRRSWIAQLASVTVSTLPLAAAAAAEGGGGTNNNPFDAIRFELDDPAGGVAFFRHSLNDRNFDAVLDFTKQYDQVLRKSAMGKAKKLLPTPELREKGTEWCNAVTFDLIGINRNARKGHENAAEAQRYLDELVNDARGLLELEQHAEVL